MGLLKTWNWRINVHYFFKNKSDAIKCYRRGERHCVLLLFFLWFAAKSQFKQTTSTLLRSAVSIVTQSVMNSISQGVKFNSVFLHQLEMSPISFVIISILGKNFNNSKKTSTEKYLSLFTRRSNYCFQALLIMFCVENWAEKWIQCKDDSAELAKKVLIFSIFQHLFIWKVYTLKWGSLCSLTSCCLFCWKKDFSEEKNTFLKFLSWLWVFDVIRAFDSQHRPLWATFENR